MLEDLPVRNLVVMWGLLPEQGVNYLKATEEALERARENSQSTDFLNPPCEIRGGTLIATVTLDTPFPLLEPDPPKHKYAALIDHRPCFKALRRSFFSQNNETLQARVATVSDMALERESDIVARSPTLLETCLALAVSMLPSEEQ